MRKNTKCIVIIHTHTHKDAQNFQGVVSIQLHNTLTGTVSFAQKIKTHVVHLYMKVFELPEPGEQSSPWRALPGTADHARGSWAPTHQQHVASAHWSQNAGRKFKESLRNQLFLFRPSWRTLCMINYEFTNLVSLQDSSQEVRFKLMERSLRLAKS